MAAQASSGPASALLLSNAPTPGPLAFASFDFPVPDSCREVGNLSLAEEITALALVQEAQVEGRIGSNGGSYLLAVGDRSPSVLVFRVLLGSPKGAEVVPMAKMDLWGLGVAPSINLRVGGEFEGAPGERGGRATAAHDPIREPPLSWVFAMQSRGVSLRRACCGHGPTMPRFGICWSAPAAAWCSSCPFPLSAPRRRSRKGCSSCRQAMRLEAGQSSCTTSGAWFLPSATGPGPSVTGEGPYLSRFYLHMYLHQVPSPPPWSTNRSRPGDLPRPLDLGHVPLSLCRVQLAPETAASLDDEGFIRLLDLAPRNTSSVATIPLGKPMCYHAARELPLKIFFLKTKWQTSFEMCVRTSPPVHCTPDVLLPGLLPLCRGHPRSGISARAFGASGGCLPGTRGRR